MNPAGRSQGMDGNDLKEIFLPIGKVVLMPVNELGKEENRKGRGNVVEQQGFLRNPGAKNPLQLRPGNKTKVNDGVQNLEKIVAKQEVPGQELLFDDAQKEIETEETVDQDQGLGWSAFIDVAEKRKRIAEGGR